MTATHFPLPGHVRDLVSARNSLRDHYAGTDLRFTFDGNLVGDLGEAVAAELFGLRLAGRSNHGIDGYTSDGRRSVQVKASGTRRGPAFRPIKEHADYLLVLHFDFGACTGEVIYNGPEAPVVARLKNFSGQRCVSLPALIRLNAAVPDHERLPMTLESTIQ